jgi:hypothetical protein
MASHKETCVTNADETSDNVDLDIELNSVSPSCFRHWKHSTHLLTP